MAKVKKSKRFGKNPEDMLVERLNQNIEFSNKATAFHGLDTYGYIMVGERESSTITSAHCRIISRFHGRRSR